MNGDCGQGRTLRCCWILVALIACAPAAWAQTAANRAAAQRAAANRAAPKPFTPSASAPSNASSANSSLAKTPAPATSPAASAPVAKTPAATNAAQTAPQSDSGEPLWIWAADQQPNKVPAGPCYFRRVFQLESPEQGQMTIACDDAYEVFVNGRRVASGKDWHVANRYDITRFLVPGRNAIAVKAENVEGSSAGLVARITVRQTGHTDVSHSTDIRWKAVRREYANWSTPQFDDRAWPAVRSLGEFGQAEPWGKQVKPAEGASAGRFRIDPSFHVERVLTGEKTGSLIAMALNEWGDLLLSVEQGPLSLVRDTNGDGVHETVTTYCDKVKSCQGILALNGQVFVVGDGPDGGAFYRLTDTDQDDVIDEVKTLFKFTEGINEHGPHAPVLGPDGLIYLMLGNHGLPEKEFSPTSPYHHYYEGDLVQPRYEDPAGHGAGVKAPAGSVIRTDQEGSVVELYAAGLRNAYDMAFNQQGELFTCDSDNESDDGLPWYRPTRVNHIIPGAEFGWRSGWAMWPDYFHDGLPNTLNIGRGSPSGIEFYNHHRYPEALRNAMFIGDWSRGRILVVRMKPNGGSYEAKAEIFLEGQPLNVTDLAVGRDGWLYFCTGGRGTEGGVYRVVFDKKLPAPPKYTGIVQALKQPQLHSAWSREQLAIIKDEMGSQWDKQLQNVLNSTIASAEERCRVLDLMQLLGPYPTTLLLVKQSTSPSELVRAKAAYLMGLHVDEATAGRLLQLLEDTDPTVRRIACESITRSQQQNAAGRLLPLLADPNRHVAYAARLAIAQSPTDDWVAAATTHARPGVFVQGATAVLALDPTPENAQAILERSGQLMRGYLSDDDFVNLLRVIELAILRAKLPAEDTGGLRYQLAEEYPSLDSRINRELVRLLAYLNEPTVTTRFLDDLQGKAPAIEKMHVALHARFITEGWTTGQKLELLEFYEQARTAEGGAGLSRYLEAVSRDFCRTFSDDEQSQVLAQATRFPTAALPALIKLPPQPGDAMIEQLKRLDGELHGMDTDGAKALSIGIVAIMARSRDPQAFAYLREQFEKDPSRRPTLAMGLAQQPGGENWPLLIRSLSILDGAAAQEVLGTLIKAEEVPDSPEPYRQTILCGLKLKDQGGEMAVALLEKWTGQKLGKADDTWEAALANWQAWFVEQHPNQPEPKLPVETEESKWSLEELVKFLDSDDGKQGQASRGQLVFEKAQCIKCHRYGQRGEPIGPDLSTVSRRFHKKEIVESVLFPSHVISDQYSSKTVATVDGRTFTGIVGQTTDGGLLILDSTGRKTALARDQVDEIQPNKKSAMPEGLFNTLSAEEIADLFAYLYGSDPTLVQRPGKERK